MPKHLLIVESPAKAKTIEKYLGADFQVMASFGHIRDLPKGNDSINVAAGFEPTYEVSPDKLEVVAKLRKQAKAVDQVWLATDEDREGEAISWHLLETLNLKLETTNRIVFNEITKPAILRAIQQPRRIDMDLVHAQQARRVLDRLVGFELSPILWKKVRAGLSAGRVQSVAVRLIVEREREVMAHMAEAFFAVNASLTSAQGKPFRAKLVKHLKDVAQAQAWLDLVAKSSLSIGDVQTKPGKRSPAAPFTTSTLQQEASRKLGYSVAQTMRIAQQLYEAGHITYMRTDSVALSETALQASEKTITTEFGARYHQRRTFKSRTANAQEAHEAIRPTDFDVKAIDGERQNQKLYELIWKRTLACQMADAVLEKTTALIDIKPATVPEKALANLLQLQAVGEVITFDGFLKLYLESTDEEDDEDENNAILPPLRVGDAVAQRVITATERFTRAPSRYTEASLVKKLEENGIGRPSTYAPTISTIQKREYVVREDREGTERAYRVLELKDGKVSARTETEITGAERSKLFPSDLGMLVNDFLVTYFAGVVDYSFTAKLEAEFDEISTGKLGWRQMLESFYPAFHQQVTTTSETAERVQGERQLGTDPKSGKPILARLGKFGPLVQLGDADDPEKTFASLMAGQRLESITLEQALKLFELPRTVGEYETKPIKANVGRFGPYLQHDGKFYSLPKGMEPISINYEQAIEVILAKRKADAERLIQTWNDGEVQLLNGRWGPYLSYKGENVKLPKGTDPLALTLDECTELYAQHLASDKPKGRFGKKAAPVKKEAAPKAKAATKPKAKTNVAATAATKKATSTAPKKTVTAKKPVAKKAAPKTSK